MSSFVMHGVKLPRWLLTVLLCTRLLASVFSAEWWWIQWPRATALEFTRLLAADKLEAAFGIMTPEEAPRAEDLDKIRGVFCGSEIEWTDFQFSDVLNGRRRFRLPFQVRHEDHDPFVGVLEFKAERGWISGGGLVSDSP